MEGKVRAIRKLDCTAYYNVNINAQASLCCVQKLSLTESNYRLLKTREFVHINVNPIPVLYSLPT